MHRAGMSWSTQRSEWWERAKHRATRKKGGGQGRATHRAGDSGARNAQGGGGVWSAQRTGRGQRATQSVGGGQERATHITKNKIKITVSRPANLYRAKQNLNGQEAPLALVMNDSRAAGEPRKPE